MEPEVAAGGSSSGRKGRPREPVECLITVPAGRIRNAIGTEDRGSKSKKRWGEALITGPSTVEKVQELNQRRKIDEDTKRAMPRRKVV